MLIQRRPLLAICSGSLVGESMSGRDVSTENADFEAATEGQWPNENGWRAISLQHSLALVASRNPQL